MGERTAALVAAALAAVLLAGCAPSGNGTAGTRRPVGDEYLPETIPPTLAAPGDQPTTTVPAPTYAPATTRC